MAYEKWRRSMFGKALITDKGTSLDGKWKEWSICLEDALHYKCSCNHWLQIIKSVIVPTGNHNEKDTIIIYEHSMKHNVIT